MDWEAILGSAFIIGLAAMAVAACIAWSDDGNEDGDGTEDL